jgi:prophage regulatory protein
MPDERAGSRPPQHRFRILGSLLGEGLRSSSRLFAHSWRFSCHTGLSRSTIYRKIAEGTFPSQLRISTNGAGWRESDINRWVADPPRWRITNDNN